MARKMTEKDFLAMTTTELMAFWIWDQTNQKLVSNHRDYEKCIAAYDAFGREGVAAILGTCGFETEDPKPKTIKLEDAKKLLYDMQTANDMRIFTAEFVKRTDNNYRKMIARFGVTKHLAGGVKAYDPKQYNLITVFDMQNSGYRSINLTDLVRLSIGGQLFVVEEKTDLLNNLPK